MEFEWDDAKHAKTLRDRGVGFERGKGGIWQEGGRRKAKVMFCMWCLLGAAQQCE